MREGSVRGKNMEKEEARCGMNSRERKREK